MCLLNITFYNKKALLFGEQLTKCLIEVFLFSTYKENRQDVMYNIYAMNNRQAQEKIIYWRDVLMHRKKIKKKIMNFIINSNTYLNI